MKKIVLIYGRPHSGKSTLLSRLSTDAGFLALDYGKKLRHIVKCDFDHPDRQKIIEATSSGRLISSELANRLLLEVLNSMDNKSGIVIDGYPRNVESIPEFQRVIKGVLGSDVRPLVVHIDMPIELSESKSRSRGRADDENVASKQRRQTNYLEQIRPLVEMLSKKYPALHLSFSDGAEHNYKAVLQRVGQ